MAETVTMPKLGFDMAEGTLVRWVIAEGEQVAKGAVLAEIETDKATVEVESSHDGVVLRHLVEEGDSVPVGAPIAYVGEEGEEVEAQPEKEETAEAGEGAPGAVTPKDTAGEEEVDQEPDMGSVGEVDMKGERPEPSEARPAQAPETSGDAYPDGVKASPLARRIAEDRDVDLTQLQGTGPAGRIVKSDVEAFLEGKPERRPAEEAQRPAAEPERKPAVPPLPAYAPVGEALPDQEVPLNRLRSAVGRRMTESKQQAPHFYVTYEYNAAPLLEVRSQVNAMLDESEKIPVDAFISKAVAVTLRSFPNLNASLAGDKIIQYGQINIGVAVALDAGLMMVVLRDADRKPLRQMGAELREMVNRVREGKVRPDDIEGSTFSISNLGMFGVEHFIAIINPPEAAIMAVGSALEVPVVENGELKVGRRMKATISVDHRVADGAEAARFMQALALNLEQPLRLLV